MRNFLGILFVVGLIATVVGILLGISGGAALGDISTLFIAAGVPVAAIGGAGWLLTYLSRRGAA